MNQCVVRFASILQGPDTMAGHGPAAGRCVIWIKLPDGDGTTKRAVPRARDGRFSGDGTYATTRKSKWVSARPGSSQANWMAAAAPVPSLS